MNLAFLTPPEIWEYPLLAFYVLMALVLLFYARRDFGRLGSLEGDQSLWCGKRPDSTSVYFCSYGCLPGYGNEWEQYFESTKFQWSGDVQISYLETPIAPGIQ